MKSIAVTLLAVITVAGCSAQPDVVSKPAEVTLLRLVIQDRVGRWEPVRIPDAEAMLLREIVKRPPDQVLTEPLPLAATYMIEIDGAKYTLEPDEIIQGNTRRWRFEGVQKRILDAVETQQGVQQRAGEVREPRGGSRAPQP